MEDSYSPRWERAKAMGGRNSGGMKGVGKFLCGSRKKEKSTPRTPGLKQKGSDCEVAHQNKKKSTQSLKKHKDS